jgi:glutathione S-transferase
MRLYMTPGSCSTGIHILLEEIDNPFEAAIVNLLAGDQFKPDYVAMNPKSTIPTLLRDDGTALTEFQTIAYWLARTKPQGEADAGRSRRRRAGDGGDGLRCRHNPHAGLRADLHDIHLHARRVRIRCGAARGREIAVKGLGLMDKVLEGKDYVAGALSIADAALFYVEFWAEKTGIELPPNCSAHYQRMRARPAVYRVLREEGYR